MGKTVMSFVSNIIGMWGIRIVGTFVCTQLLGMGLISAWACMIAHNLLLFVLFVIWYVTGKWNPMNKSGTGCTYVCNRFPFSAYGRKGRCKNACQS